MTTAEGQIEVKTMTDDLIIALRQLCEATEKQRASNGGKESILVSMRRNNAKKMLAKYEPAFSPNIQDEPHGGGADRAS